MEEQTAFVKGRSITDGVMIVNEVSHSILRNQTEGIILKLDFAKAFDSVSWHFLFHILESLNFGDRWCLWIKSILHSMKMSVLINDSPTEEFKTARGLRQGDPLSPMFFNLIGQVLHLLIVKGEEIWLIKGITLGLGPSLTHLQFTDDYNISQEHSAFM